MVLEYVHVYQYHKQWYHCTMVRICVLFFFLVPGTGTRVRTVVRIALEYGNTSGCNSGIAIMAILVVSEGWKRCQVSLAVEYTCTMVPS
jgi:hypothetical protein